MTLTEKADLKAIKDMSVLGRFVALYCKDKHAGQPKHPFSYRGIDDKTWRRIQLCEECEKLLTHGTAKRLMCPFDPKPMCKKCPEHCYGPGYRDSVREIMRYSGAKMIKRGRIDLIFHYFF